MKRRTEIEAALERSFRNQVNVPPLDGRFDAKVWARIGVEESHARARLRSLFCVS